MLSFCILSSGSSGNAAIIQTDLASILIDCGIGAKSIISQLNDLEINPKDLTAVVLSHAHSDHLNPSALNFLIKNDIPIYANSAVLDDLYYKFGGKMDDCQTRAFGESFKIKDIDIESFRTYHKDNYISGSFGFTFSAVSGGQTYKIGFITDTGKICPKIADKLKDSHILTIEANYDYELLETSFRRQGNKDWIAGDYGHLSNEDCAKSILEIKKLSKVQNSLKHIFLAHLSAQHNTQIRALQTVSQILKDCAFAEGTNILAADRHKKTEKIRID
ncbi:MAG: MBL fold metallo-hydrolase [Elusimicrobiota bacterium]|jgi:phosphoribosyl 1,2-cyclic phosphodiesterase|nr:MBL fold metallo-hydrolase [Elusimicrobiota bacterium]